jgi:hypothetical protein
MLGFGLRGGARRIMTKISFFPKNECFYDLFEQQAANLVVAAELLVDLFEHYEQVEEKVERLKELEDQGDMITHQVMSRLHRTFITPFDREDMALLSHTLDDVLDFVEAAGRTAFLYRVEQPTERARELAAVVLRVTHKLRDGLPLLRLRKQPGPVLELCVEINTLENEADDIHHAAQAELFDSRRDVRDIIKWREIYAHLENATDRGEDVANILESIVLKNA